MRKNIVAVLLLTIVIAGCASGPPDWTDSGKSKEFPGSRYFTGFGTSTNLDAAKSRARGNLTDQFLKKVTDADRKSTRLNSSHTDISRMPSSA